MSSAAILFSLAVAVLLSTMFLGIGRSGNSVTGLAIKPFGLFGSASSDALNFLFRERRSGSVGALDKASLGGATLAMEGFWTLRRSEGYFWAPKSALLTRVEVRRAVMVGNALVEKPAACRVTGGGFTGLVPADRSEGRDELTIMAERRIEEHLSARLRWRWDLDEGVGL